MSHVDVATVKESQHSFSPLTVSAHIHSPAQTIIFTVGGFGGANIILNVMPKSGKHWGACMMVQCLGEVWGEGHVTILCMSITEPLFRHLAEVAFSWKNNYPYKWGFISQSIAGFVCDVFQLECCWTNSFTDSLQRRWKALEMISITTFCESRKTLLCRHLRSEVFLLHINSLGNDIVEVGPVLIREIGLDDLLKSLPILIFYDCVIDGWKILMEWTAPGCHSQKEYGLLSFNI